MWAAHERMRQRVVGEASPLWNGHAELALGLAVSIPSGVDKVVAFRASVQEFVFGAGMMAEAVGASGFVSPTVVHEQAPTPCSSSIFVGVGRTALDVTPWSCPSPEPNYDYNFCCEYISSRADKSSWLARAL